MHKKTGKTDEFLFSKNVVQFLTYSYSVKSPPSFDWFLFSKNLPPLLTGSYLPKKPVLWLKHRFDALFYIMCNLISLFSFVYIDKKV